MRNMETRMAAGREEERRYSFTRQEIGSIEISREMIVEMCGQQSRAGTEWIDGRLNQETQQLA